MMPDSGNSSAHNAGPDPTIAQDAEHVFVIPCLVVANRRMISQVRQRSYFVPESGAKFSALEIYCQHCRRPYEDVRDSPCAAKIDNTHLRGGPIGTREPRDHSDHNCVAHGCNTAEVMRQRAARRARRAAEG